MTVTPKSHPNGSEPRESSRLVAEKSWEHATWSAGFHPVSIASPDRPRTLHAQVWQIQTACRGRMARQPESDSEGHSSSWRWLCLSSYRAMVSICGGSYGKKAAAQPDRL